MPTNEPSDPHILEVIRIANNIKKTALSLSAKHGHGDLSDDIRDELCDVANALGGCMDVMNEASWMPSDLSNLLNLINDPAKHNTQCKPVIEMWNPGMHRSYDDAKNAYGVYVPELNLSTYRELLIYIIGLSAFAYYSDYDPVNIILRVNMSVDTLYEGSVPSDIKMRNTSP